MSNFKTARVNDDEILSPSSDEKMDTGSESFRSQDTPNSVLSSDFEGDDQNVLRLQNPEVLRLSDPEANDNLRTLVSKFKEDINDSLISRMENLNINSPKDKIGISPPKFSSTLTLTTNHPLMGLGSPDENYPDLIPKKITEVSNGDVQDDFYSPQRNTSKNNLYFSENFVTADSITLETKPDITKMQRKMETPEKNVYKYLDRKLDGHSTPTTDLGVDIPQDGLHSRVAEWCESPSHLRRMPKFELPIEMSSSIGVHNDLDSPDVVSSSTQEDRSAYQALLDPYTGSVALRPTAQRSPAVNNAPPRRKIQLPPEDDRCSLDSLSACSMESEEEPPAPEGGEGGEGGDGDKGCKSSSPSSSSSPIPEYSAADELDDERSWLRVPGAATCDMKVIEPYKRVISHGGYDGRGAAVIVFGACHLPDSARPDYRYVMDNLFLYVIWSLERLVTEEYVLVYLHGSAGSRRLPSFAWLHECYKLIDRRLRKSLKHLYLVHPTFWLKSFVLLTKPFVSSKFFRKLSYVRSLEELNRLVPVEPNAIPDIVKQFDATKR